MQSRSCSNDCIFTKRGLKIDLRNETIVSNKIEQLLMKLDHINYKINNFSANVSYLVSTSQPKHASSVKTWDVVKSLAFNASRKHFNSEIILANKNQIYQK